MPTVEEIRVTTAATTSVLSPADCLALLATEHIGRLGFVAHDEPVILPITYALDDDVVTFRTAPAAPCTSRPGGSGWRWRPTASTGTRGPAGA